MDIAPLRRVPHLMVYGDFMDRSVLWPKILPATFKYREALAAQGGVADVLELPKAGVRGNTHMLMMDRNSDVVAGLGRIGWGSMDWRGRNG